MAPMNDAPGPSLVNVAGENSTKMAAPTTTLTAIIVTTATTLI